MTKTRTRIWLAALVSPVLFGPAPAVAQEISEGDMITLRFAVIGSFALLIYFIPSIVAFVRRHPNRWLILVVNTVFGGTVLGWFGPLVWAFHGIHRSETGNHGGESGLNLFANDVQPVRILHDVGPRSKSASPIDEIARLKALHDSGALSGAEYEQLKKRVIS